MATSQSLQFVHFTFPPSKPPFYKSSPPWSSKPSDPISPPNTSDNQIIHRPTATFSHPKYQTKAGGNTIARAADTHLPSLEKQSLAGLRPSISAEASNTGSTLQRLEQPALHWPGLQVNRTQPESGEPQDGSRNQPVILDNHHHPLKAGAAHKAGDTSDNCNTGHIERATSQHNTFTTSELASEPHGVASPPAQAQPQTLPQPSKPLEDQNTQQGVDHITQCTSVDSALHSIAKASDSSDNRWTEKDTTILERELELVWGVQPVEPSSVGTSATPSPHSVKALQDEIKSREREIAEGILKELQDFSRRGSPAQDLEWCEQRETQVVKGGAVAMQQQEELAQPPVGDVQDLVEVEDANDHEDKEATEALPAAQPKIDEQRFRLRGVRTRQLPGRQTKTTQYRLVWGQRSNKLDSWLNEEDVQISMPYLSNSQDLALPIRVRKIRPSLQKGRKVFEYLVDVFDLDNSTWTTEDQLRISLSPMLALELEGSSPHPLREAQCDVLLSYSVTPIRDEHGSVSRTSRSSSAQTDSALGQGIEPTTLKRGHRDMYTEISSDTDDNNPRPTKQRKSRSAPAVTPPIHLRQSPQPPTTGVEIDEIQSHDQDDDRCSLTSVEEQHFISQISRSLSAATEAGSAATYQEWPLHGFLRRTKTGRVRSFNLEFHLVDVKEDLDYSSPFQALGSHLGKATSRLSKNRAQSREDLVPDWAISTQRRGDELTRSQESLLAKMIQDNMTWTEIKQHFPGYPLQLLKDNFFKKQGGKPRKRGRKPGVKVSGA